VKRYPLLAFLVITFVLSWGAWIGTIPKMPGGHGFLPLSPKHGQLMAGFAPGIAAVILAGFTGGIPALQRLFERLLIWRVGSIWYLFALLLPSGISLFTTALHTMFGGDAPDFAAPPIARTPLPAFLTGWSPLVLALPLLLYHALCGTSLGEELGWRGIMLTRLQQKRTPAQASVIIGLLWALWVLPLYWLQGWLGTDPRSLYLLSSIPGAFLSTWIFNGSRGSLLLVLLFNVSLKVTDLVLAAPPAHPILPVFSYWTIAILVWCCARRPAATTTADPLQPVTNQSVLLESAVPR